MRAGSSSRWNRCVNASHWFAVPHTLLTRGQIVHALARNHNTHTHMHRLIHNKPALPGVTLHFIRYTTGVYVQKHTNKNVSRRGKPHTVQHQVPSNTRTHAASAIAFSAHMSVPHAGAYPAICKKQKWFAATNCCRVRQIGGLAAIITWCRESATAKVVHYYPFAVCLRVMFTSASSLHFSCKPKLVLRFMWLDIAAHTHPLECQRVSSVFF